MEYDISTKDYALKMTLIRKRTNDQTPVRCFFCDRIPTIHKGKGYVVRCRCGKAAHLCEETSKESAIVDWNMYHDWVKRHRRFYEATHDEKGNILK